MRGRQTLADAPPASTGRCATGKHRLMRRRQALADAHASNVGQRWAGEHPLMGDR
jgi:hypothetical protein